MSKIHLIIYMALLGGMWLSSCTEQLDINPTGNAITLRAEVENEMPATRTSNSNYATPVSNKAILIFFPE